MVGVKLDAADIKRNRICLTRAAQLCKVRKATPARVAGKHSALYVQPTLKEHISRDTFKRIYYAHYF
jgi:hypothetical protein